MSNMLGIKFSCAVSILIALGKGQQEVKGIANAVGEKGEKVAEWLEAFRWAGIISLTPFTEEGKVHFLWGFTIKEEAPDEINDISERMDTYKAKVARLLKFIILSPRTVNEIADFCDMGSWAIHQYIKVLQEKKLVQSSLSSRKNKRGPTGRRYTLQLFTEDGKLITFSSVSNTDCSVTETEKPKNKRSQRKPVVGFRKGVTPLQKWVRNFPPNQIPPKPNIFDLLREVEKLP